MRIGATLILENARCLQSYGWELFRPLGSLQLAMNSLEEYECDEVAIIRPVRDKDSLELFAKDLEAVRILKTMTPISFGGGIRTLEHLDLLKDLPIERLIFSSAFISENVSLIDRARNLFGQQAIQCLLPVKFDGGTPMVYQCNKNDLRRFDELNLALIDELSNEVVLYDIEHDGCRDSFNELLVKTSVFDKNKLVITGGVGKSTVGWAKQQGLASVLVDNKILHSEYSIKGFKHH